MDFLIFKERTFLSVIFLKMYREGRAMPAYIARPETLACFVDIPTATEGIEAARFGISVGYRIKKGNLSPKPREIGAA